MNVRQRIASVETFLVPPGWVLIRVETDAGVVGWGEAGVQTRARTIATAIDEVTGLVIGHDAAHIERLWQRMTRSGFYRGGPILSAAIAGIDEALWDIAGKVHGCPVHELLGGAVRDRQWVYCWVGEGGESPDELAALATERRARGHTAVKMTTPPLARAAPPAQIAVVADSARALRDAMGADGAFAIDFHGRADGLTARRLIAAVAEFSPLFVEEPVLPDQQDLLIRLAAASPVPIATGERLYCRAEVAHLLPSAVDILQPDVSNAAGISELRRIATLAETYGVELAPHCAIGPIALAASLQVCFASPNALIQERDLEWAREHALRYVPDLSGFDVTAGHVELPTRPGLGIDVDEAAVRAAAGVASQHPPIMSHADGSFQEW